MIQDVIMNEKGPVREIDIVIEWIQNRSKIIWWAFLLILLSYYVWKNSNRILSENPITIDYFIVILLFLLLLLPLASEINFLGFSIKKEIESIKSEIKGEFVSLRSEIHNSISLQQVFHAAPQPLPDEKLKEILKNFFPEQTKIAPEKVPEVDKLDKLEIPKKILNLVKVRIMIENEILRIHKVRFSGEFFKDSRRLSNFPEMIRSLHNEGFIDSQLFGLLQEIRIISNNAAHGGDITDEQYEFVETIFPIVIGTLKRL